MAVEFEGMWLHGADDGWLAAIVVWME